MQLLLINLMFLTTLSKFGMSTQKIICTVREFFVLKTWTISGIFKAGGIWAQFFFVDRLSRETRRKDRNAEAGRSGETEMYYWKIIDKPNPPARLAVRSSLRKLSAQCSPRDLIFHILTGNNIINLIIPSIIKKTINTKKLFKKK